MSGDEQTAVDPKTALSGASQLTGVGDHVQARWNSAAERINGLNGQSPWGNDEVGKKFNEHYLDGGDKAPATNVLSVGQSLVTALAKLGPQVTDGVRGTEDIDDLTKLWFGKQ